jgi:REP element-mobilizing transposase RayT
MNDSSHFYRRRLPHYRERDAIYFVTWRLAAGRELSAPERDLVAAELQHFHGQRYVLYASVVMNDHVHALVRILDEKSLEKIIHSWKSFTTHAMQRRHGRRGRVWQDEYFDRIVRDEKELGQKFDYIQGNPWARWPELKDYSWVWPQPRNEEGGHGGPPHLDT